MAGLFDHGVTGIIVRQGKYNPGLIDDIYQVFGFLQRVGHGFVADDIDSGIGKGLGNRKMHEIRRDNRDEINAIALGQFGFLRCHLLPGLIGPILAD